MSKLRSIAAVCGLAAFLGLAGGAVAVSLGQFTSSSSSDRGDVDPQRRKAARDRVAALRTEVELMQVEHDADHGDLAERLAKLRKHLRDGMSPEEQRAIQEMSSLFNDASEHQKAGMVAGLAKLLKENSEAAKELTAIGIIDPNKVDLSRLMGDPQVLLKINCKAAETKLRAGIAEKTAAFAKTARALIEKKLDLDDAEFRFNQVRHR